MPAYTSTLNEMSVEQVCGMSVLPIKTSIRGPAPHARDGEEDIIDEAIKFFRANILFASFDVHGGADRALLYLTLYISQCLKRMEKAGNKASGNKILFELAKEKFPMPGESGWPLGGHILRAQSRDEDEKARAYLKQLREETGIRMLEVLYADDDSAPNKFWMGFSKHKFMNILVR